MKKIIYSFIYATLFFGTVMPGNTFGAYSQDNTTGSYTDDFADNTGLAIYHGSGGSTYAKVDTTAGAIKLTNVGGTFTTPYRTSGYVITKTIMPQSVSAWGTLNLVASQPANTTVKVQVLGDGNDIYLDSQVPGNSAGLAPTNIDLSSLNPLSIPHEDVYNSNSKIGRLRFKILLTTTNTNVTPTVDSLSFTWKPKADTLPTASTINDSGWATTAFDQKGTNHSSYPSLNYPVIRWKSDTFNNVSGGVNNPRIYGNSIVSQTWFLDAHSYWIDKNSGDILRDSPLENIGLGDGVIDKNGIMYTYEIGNDMATAIDLSTGEIKWTYALGGGHGVSKMLIGNDGTLFALYYNTNPNSGDFTLYAFNPNGTIKFTRAFDVTDQWSAFAGGIVMDSQGRIIFGTSTINSSYVNTGGGKLYCLSPTDGAVVWSNAAGDFFTSNPVIDSSDNIYIGQFAFSPSSPQKIFSFNSSGNLRWEKSIATTYRGWGDLTLGSDGKLYGTTRNTTDDSSSRLEIRDTATGNIIEETEGYSANYMFSDSNNQLYYAASDFTEGNNYFNLYSRDADLNLKWKVFSLPSVDNETTSESYGFDRMVQDERGWLFGTQGKSVYDPALDYEEVFSSEYASFYALAPWTISSSVANPETLAPGQTAHFTVTTSMQRTNLINGGNNQMQIVMENDDIVPLTYSSTNSNGDTVWTGSYVLPAGTSKNPIYTVEANAEGIQTDIAVNFASPATNSANTGFKLVTSLFGDKIAPVFSTLPGEPVPINITDGQVIETNPYIIKVRPTDNVAVDRVEFFVDGTKICTDTTADSNGVYSCSWDTSKCHSDITVIAYDTAGNQSLVLSRQTTVRLGTLPVTGVPIYLYFLAAILPVPFVLKRKRHTS